MINKINRLTAILLLIPAGLALTACLHDDDDPAMASYDVTVTNLTNGQPMTPVAVIAHNAAFSPWSVGEAASDGLEMLAESGDPGMFISDAGNDSNVSGTAASTAGPFGPGTAQTVPITVKRNDAMQISVASMLANTNDAFIGVTHIDVGNLAMGGSTSMMAHVYDAGTEANTETAATMPGPAAGGEGFNVARDDGDFISIHGGVVTSDDGLATSALDESHRWNGLAAQVVITRTK